MKNDEKMTGMKNVQNKDTYMNDNDDVDNDQWAN